MLKSLIWIVIGIRVLMGVLAAPLAFPSVASSRVESRLSQLEFQVRSLRSQLSQIESRLSSRSSTTTASPPIAVPSLPGDLSLETQFDNLATLAIELKQDLRQLEQRVTALEATVEITDP